MKLGLAFWRKRAVAHLAMARADFRSAERAYLAGLIGIARANWSKGLENTRRAADCAEQAAMWREAT